MTGPGRPPEGAVREVRIPDDLYAQLRAEARRQSIPIAAMLRRILTERYEGKTP